MAESSYQSPVYHEQGGGAIRVKEGSQGVVETGAIPDVNTLGQAPVLHRIAKGNTADTTLVTLEHKTRVIEAWAVKAGANGGAGDTVTVKNGTNAITDALSLNCNDKTVVRAGTIDDAYHEIAAGSDLAVTTAKASNCQCIVYVLGIRVL